MNFDDIIIGSGPGGYTLAGRLVAAGRKVAVIERDRPGGTCLNRGCIPTKCLCATADVLTTCRRSAEFGVLTADVTLDYTGARRHMDQVVAELGQGVLQSIEGATLIQGEARLLGGNAVAVGDQRLTAERIIIATGSQPAILPVPGKECALTSDDLLAATTLPQSCVIIGGGVIGIEFASILNSFGCDVTVVEYCKEILPVFDGDMAKRLRSYLSRRGIKFVTSARVTAIRDGKEVVYETKKGEASVWADQVVMAVGRKACLPPGCEEAGIAFERGFIAVDDQMRTSAEGIYAIGDVNGRCLLAHAAEAQANIIAGDDVDMAVIPSVVFCHPEAACVGLGEERCKAEDICYRTVRANFAGNGKAKAMGETDGAVKIIYAEESRRLLGCQIIGAHAAELIGEIAALLIKEATIDDLQVRLIHAHPTLSEIFL